MGFRTSLRVRVFKRDALFFAGITPFIFVFISGCDSLGRSPFGAPMNEMRQRHGIPIIPTDWVQHSNPLSWVNPTADASKFVGHDTKTVIANNGQLDYESDGYTLSKTYPDRNPKAPKGSVRHQRVEIRYYYKDGNRKTPWECRYFNEDGRHEISLKEAERILKKDGIPRLNYEPEEGCLAPADLGNP